MSQVTDHARSPAMRPMKGSRSDRPARRPPSRSGGLLMLAGVGVLALGACSLDGLLKSNELPPNVTDPALMESPDGARAAYYSALQQLHMAFGASGSDLSFLKATGYLSDELSGDPGWIPYPQLDFRQLAQAQTDASARRTFGDLNNLRQRTGQAIGLSGDFLPEEPALRAHLYAVEGYAEVMLAELYCSGIPLSTVDYHGDYTLRPGSTTTEVFRHAAALFDTALTLAGTTDSERILNLSRVGRGRALLGLGDYAAAAAAVTAVPDTFRYTALYNGSDSARGPGWDSGVSSWSHTGVQDREGTNGLDYVSSGDPRVQTTLYTNNFYYPAKYHPDGQDTAVLASGVEARLIEAEAALQQGNGAWLDKLNALRTDGTQDGSGTYNPGTGGVAGLAPLDDPDPSAAPGSTPSRVDLLFRERAFWLFLTGHRQGDMRRLVRQYHRPQSQVYPVGVHAGTGEAYGSSIDLPIPVDEQTLNPLFSGCFSRD